MAKPNYYDVLRVSRTATETDIKQAYRHLAREFHPDVNPSPDAEERFKVINLAYATLSDSLKRADYDQSLRDPGVRGTAASRTYASPSDQPTPEASSSGAASESPYRQAMMRAAFARTLAAGFMAGIAGVVLQYAMDYLTERPSGSLAAIIGFLPAALVGGLYAADLNFKVETFLGASWLGRSYTFARTILMSLALGYYFGLVGAAIDHVVSPEVHLLGPVLMVVGILTGAVIGSDGDTPEKLRSGPGRFNLLYTFLRGAEVGVIGALIGGAIGAILSRVGIAGVWGWSAFVGFSLGMIIGSIKPPNLAAYASYASASVKNVLIILMVLAALLAGIGFGVVFQPTLSTFLKF